MSTETMARLRISLSDTRPEVWRLIDVPLAIDLKTLHYTVQAAMGWEDDLWEFEVGDWRYGLVDPEWPDDERTAAEDVTLGALIERGIRQLGYTYDMGDDWHHRLTVQSVGPGEADTPYPCFVAGARRCPPEDIGGVPGYETFLDILADPEHEEHAEVIEWLGHPYDPDTLDKPILKGRVAAIANRRAAGMGA